MADGIDRILENHAKVVEEGFVREGDLRYKSYAVTTLRGGVGKSTLSFNLAYEMSRKHSVLIADLCAQRNLTENLMKGFEIDVTLLDALQPALLGAAFGDVPDDISYRTSSYCESFKGARHLISFLVMQSYLPFPRLFTSNFKLPTRKTIKQPSRTFLRY